MKLETVQAIVKKGTPWIQKIEGFTKPRKSYICKSPAGRAIIGASIALMSISMMTPIPGTNTLPAIGIFVTGFGLIEDDGLVTLGGLLLSLLGAIVSVSTVLAVYWGGSSLVDMIQSSI